MNHLQVFNHEFTDLDDLEQLVKELNYDLNFEEISQGTFERPVDRWSLEKENLKRVNLDHLQSYYEETSESRKVSKEAMVIYNYQKYSIPISYIGKIVTSIVDENLESYDYLNELIEKLDRAHKRGTLEAALKRYSRYGLLIIDVIGYLPMTKNGANLLFQLINLRYEKKSTILTSNIPLSQWSDVFQDKKLTNVIIDRLIHHSKILSINGKSYRMKDYTETKVPAIEK
jgi:hypothetical protein